jgi:acetyltransferase-like isoleucine patch superfamily enzyme
LQRILRIIICLDTNLFITFFNYILFRLRHKNIIAHHKTIIKNIHNISTKGLLKIGLKPVGFVHNKDITLLNIGGRLNVNGNFSIGRGCRFDIGEDAVVNIGNNSYINPLSTFIIMHGLDIGDNCAISWECQFLDESFHEIHYEGKKEHEHKITIGDHVWIGSRVSIYNGSTIPNGCVVASNSVVKRVFSEENALIAGNPATIIKHNINWS